MKYFRLQFSFLFPKPRVMMGIGTFVYHMHELNQLKHLIRVNKYISSWDTESIASKFILTQGVWSILSYFRKWWISVASTTVIKSEGTRLFRLINRTTKKDDNVRGKLGFAFGYFVVVAAGTHLVSPLQNQGSWLSLFIYWDTTSHTTATQGNACVPESWECLRPPPIRGGLYMRRPDLAARVTISKVIDTIKREVMLILLSLFIRFYYYEKLSICNHHRGIHTLRLGRVVCNNFLPNTH